MNGPDRKAARFYAREFFFFAGVEGTTPRAFVEAMLSDYADLCGDEAMAEQGAAFAYDARRVGVEAFALEIIRIAARLRASGNAERIGL